MVCMWFDVGILTSSLISCFIYSTDIIIINFCFYFNILSTDILKCNEKILQKKLFYISGITVIFVQGKQVFLLAI